MVDLELAYFKTYKVKFIKICTLLVCIYLTTAEMIVSSAENGDHLPICL